MTRSMNDCRMIVGKHSGLRVVITYDHAVRVISRLLYTSN